MAYQCVQGIEGGNFVYCTVYGGMVYHCVQCTELWYTLVYRVLIESIPLCKGYVGMVYVVCRVLSDGIPLCTVY
jgi:hypothetical protein